jgi:hypothetical protein
MSRTRVVLGLMAAVIGTAWWAGALPKLWISAVDVAPYLLIALAVLACVRVAAPAAAFAAPALLLAAGAGWLVIRADLVPDVDVPAVLGATLIVAGCALALSRRRPRWRPDFARRHRSFFWRRRPIEVTGTAPAHLVLTALFGEIVVDLTNAEYPAGGADALEIDVTAILGHVDIRLNPNWQVGPGRIIERAVHLRGTLDWVAPDVLLSARGLPAAITARQPVVVNVVGLLGAVTLPLRPAPGPS